MKELFHGKSSLLKSQAKWRARSSVNKCMDNTQFKLLIEQLTDLCGTPDETGSFKYKNLSFRVLHGTEASFSWVDLLADVMALTEENAIDSMAAAMSMNVEVMRKGLNPAWFGLSQEGPSIVLIQRFYGDVVQSQDILNYLLQIDSRCIELNQMIASALASNDQTE